MVCKYENIKYLGDIFMLVKYSANALVFLYQTIFRPLLICDAVIFWIIFNFKDEMKKCLGILLLLLSLLL